jgi:hypothetical protein
MDHELIEYLQAMEARLNDRFRDEIQHAKTEMITASRTELKPLADLIESLGTEVHDGFARTDSRLEAVQVRLDLQGGKLRAGSVWTARLDEWSDKVDHLIAERDKQIADLQNRIAKLERPKP